MNFSPIVLTGSSTGMYIMIAYIAVFAGLIYFMSIRPNRNRQKKLDAMIASLEIGDSVLTTSGFYGVVIDIADDVVVVEFGSDRHCRIPMQKSAIVSVEKVSSAE
jgi:preprotein translocase subunit YajC